MSNEFVVGKTYKLVDAAALGNLPLGFTDNQFTVDAVDAFGAFSKGVTWQGDAWDELTCNPVGFATAPHFLLNDGVFEEV